MPPGRFLFDVCPISPNIYIYIYIYIYIHYLQCISDIHGGSFAILLKYYRLFMFIYIASAINPFVLKIEVSVNLLVMI